MLRVTLMQPFAMTRLISDVEILGPETGMLTKLIRIPCRLNRLAKKCLPLHPLRHQRLYGTNSPNAVCNCFEPTASDINRRCVHIQRLVVVQPSNDSIPRHSASALGDGYQHPPSQPSIARPLRWYPSNSYHRRSHTKYNSKPTVQRSIIASNVPALLSGENHRRGGMLLKHLRHRCSLKSKREGWNESNLRAIWSSNRCLHVVHDAMRLIYHTLCAKGWCHNHSGEEKNCR